MGTILNEHVGYLSWLFAERQPDSCGCLSNPEAHCLQELEYRPAEIEQLFGKGQSMVFHHLVAKAQIRIDQPLQIIKIIQGTTR